MNIYIFCLFFSLFKLIFNQNSCYYDEVNLNNSCIKCSTIFDNCLTCSKSNSTILCNECFPQYKANYDRTNNLIISCTSLCLGKYSEIRDIYSSDFKDNCLISQWGYDQSLFTQIDNMVPIPRTTSISEKEALYSLYENLNGNFWKNNNNWLVDDPCTNNWYGIYCNKYGNIIGLYFLDNFLNGIIPDSVENLVNLKYIYIQNSLYIENPGTIWRVSKNLFTLELKEIVLYNLGINEDIYTNLFNNTKLQIVDLSNNKIKGTVSRGHINSNLIILRLTNNLLAGTLLFLDDFSNLEVIELQNNKFTGEIPIFLKLKESLRIFDIRNNDLSGTFPIDYLNQMIFKKLEYVAMHLNAKVAVPDYCSNNALCLSRIYSNTASGDDMNFNMTTEMLKYLEK